MSYLVFGLPAVFFLFVLAMVATWAVRTLSGSGIILIAGLGVFFVGERILGFGTLRMPVDLLGLVLVTAAILLRAYVWKRSTGPRRSAHAMALGFTAVTVIGLVLYGLTLPTITDGLGLEESSLERWSGSFRALCPVLITIGTGPILMIDRVLSSHRRMLPELVARRALESGLASALVLTLVFPINYIATHHSAEWDYAYFRTTRPGTSTISLAATLPEPISATLWFPPGNDVAQQVEPYFRELSEKSSGQLTFQVADQALSPELAKELNIRENGFITFQMGDNDAKFKVGTDLDRAKRDLKKLDQEVNKHLMKISREKRKILMLAGHGEANHREKDNPLRKLSQFKKDLEAQNMKVESFGVADGSGVAVPDDAAAVVIAAPRGPLLPEETTALVEFFEGGGALMVPIHRDM